MRQFGIGRLGAAIADRARLFAVISVALTLGAFVSMVGGLEFNGDVANVLKVDSPGYRALKKVEADFHPFSTDEVVVVESSGFDNPETFQVLEDLVVELNLLSGVEAAISIFSLPADGASADPYLGSPAANALPPADRLRTLLQRQFLARDLLSEDLTTTLVVLMISGDGGTGLSDDRRGEIAGLAAASAPALTITAAGMTEIHKAIEVALRQDQRKLATISTLLCVLLSLLVFRSWRGALICAIPPVAGVLWFFGFAGLVGITIDPITAIIPTLLIVVGFADSVHLYFTYLRQRADDHDRIEAVRRTMRETGPACFLTSLTTAVACLGIGIAGSKALDMFAVGGFFGMAIQFLAVLLLFPLLAVWLGPDKKPPQVPETMMFMAVSRSAAGLLGHGRCIVGFSVLLLAVLLYAQSQLPIGFRLSEHLRGDTPLAMLQTRLAEKGLGSAYLYLVVTDADSVQGVGADDLAAFDRIGKALFGDGPAGDGAFGFLNAEQFDRLADEDHPLAKRFIAGDRLSYLIPIPIDPTLPSNEIAGEAADIKARLRDAGLEQEFEIVGMPLLSATEVPAMINDLRLGFYVALVLVVALLIVATGSVRLGLLSLIPNLIPILGVEAMLYLASQTLTMTAAVALTLAFGIAVDNSIHLLNRYQREQTETGLSRLASAVSHIASPITATTILLVVGMSVTQISSLPTVAIFGRLVSTALVLAMISSLYLLPAFIEPNHRRREGP
ncbi:MAG: MMPL family transporter [Rhizobiaceae bacterium]